MRNDLQAAVGTLERRKHYLSECMKESNNPWAETNQTEIGALATALSALWDALQRQPDPITGLVPCGCGGKAKITEQSLNWLIKCVECGIQLEVYGGRGGAVWSWNRAMGYKGQ